MTSMTEPTWQITTYKEEKWIQSQEEKIFSPYKIAVLFMGIPAVRWRRSRRRQETELLGYQCLQCCCIVSFLGRVQKITTAMMSFRFLCFTVLTTAVLISAFLQPPGVTVNKNTRVDYCDNGVNRRHLSMLAKGFGGDVIKTKTKQSNTVDNKENSKLGPWKITEPRNEVFEKSLVSMEQSHLASKSIESYLNPLLLADPSLLKTAAEQIRAGNVVVLKDALDPILAEATHRELRAASAPWEHNEPYFDDGYHFKHSNIFKRELWSARLNSTMEIFESEETKAWMTQLTGRDCGGVTTGAPSYYRAGDHSLPHTDWAGQRTVAYVWHLSKDWLPAWGGALYWCNLPHAKATIHASFNSLVLFSVNTKSSHFVTTVSPHATSKRLTFNGWYQSNWLPQVYIPPLPPPRGRIYIFYTSPSPKHNIYQSIHIH